MHTDQSRKYESRLIALTNTRLLFNTMAELEEFLGNTSIHTNGIRRCYPNFPRLRALYRDINVEVTDLTDELFDFGWLMLHYERAWNFFTVHFARRKDPEAIAHKILSLYYDASGRDTLSSRFAAIYKALIDENINVAILYLLLMKAIPGYDSKLGDVADIDAQFDKILDHLQRFTDGCGIFDQLPVIKMAREETRRTRLMLICHTIRILDTYENYSGIVNLAHTSTAIKESSLDLDVEGFWRPPFGSDFWEVTKAANKGTYFVTHYRHESSRLLIIVNYTLHLILADNGRLTAYIMHPLAVKHRVKGLPYTDQDHAWYYAEFTFPDSDIPDECRLIRAMRSETWPYEISLTRLNNAWQIQRLRNQIATHAIINHYQDCEYTLYRSVCAISDDHVYIRDEERDCYYQLPRHTEHQFETIDLDDNVGILEIDGKRYIAIEERLLYIPITSRSLQKYRIATLSTLFSPDA